MSKKKKNTLKSISEANIYKVLVVFMNFAHMTLYYSENIDSMCILLYTSQIHFWDQLTQQTPPSCLVAKLNWTLAGWWKDSLLSAEMPWEKIVATVHVSSLPSLNKKQWLSYCVSRRWAGYSLKEAISMGLFKICICM